MPFVSGLKISGLVSLHYIGVQHRLQGCSSFLFSWLTEEIHKVIKLKRLSKFSKAFFGLCMGFLPLISSGFISFPPSLTLAAEERWWMSMWEPQRQQHYREMDRWKGRRVGEQNENESSNTARPSSRLSTHCHQCAAMLEITLDVTCLSLLRLQKTL